MSRKLIAFFKAWLDWVDNGAPERDPFSRSSGLCHAAEEGGHDVRSELKEIFYREAHAGLIEDPVYPFEEGDYDKRLEEWSMHECPKRIAWVREKLKAAGEIE